MGTTREPPRTITFVTNPVKLIPDGPDITDTQASLTRRRARCDGQTPDQEQPMCSFDGRDVSCQLSGSGNYSM